MQDKISTSKTGYTLKPFSTDDYSHVCLSGLNLWETLDRDASEARTARNATADATVEVQRYMTDPPLERSKDPLAYWVDHQNVYPNLFKLAKQFVCQHHPFHLSECFQNAGKL